MICRKGALYLPFDGVEDVVVTVLLLDGSDEVDVVGASFLEVVELCEELIPHSFIIA